MTAVSWPIQGDQTTFRRWMRASSLVGALLCAASICAVFVVGVDRAIEIVPLTLASLALLIIWSHSAARRAARRAEVSRSFAGLRVLHQGHSLEVAADPILGEYSTRRHASHAAMEHGSWAVIVRAWNRYYVLASSPARETGRAPVTFRNRAVADVIPAIDDTTLASA